MPSETSCSVGLANAERRALINASCQTREETGLCLEAPEYCRKCEGCQQPVCDLHRVMVNDRVLCIPCAAAEMDLDERADALLASEAA